MKPLPKVYRSRVGKNRGMETNAKSVFDETAPRGVEPPELGFVCARIFFELLLTIFFFFSFFSRGRKNTNRVEIES